MTKENTVTGATAQMFSHNSLIAKKRKGNTDAKQVASRQKWEPYYISWAYSIPIDDVRAVMKELSTTRRTVIYDALRKLGYEIDTKNRRK